MYRSLEVCTDVKPQRLMDRCLKDQKYVILRSGTPNYFHYTEFYVIQNKFSLTFQKLAKSDSDYKLRTTNLSGTAPSSYRTNFPHSYV